MPSALEVIPTEILQEVCAILDTVHPDSLLAFARASKDCYSIASTVLYRTIKVAIADPRDGHEPFQFVEGLQTRLLRDHAFEHVRRLILCAPEDTSIEPAVWPYSSLEPCERSFEEDTGQRSCWEALYFRRLLNLTFVPDRDWEPVIHLVERLLGLDDLYWVCHKRLPLRLLNVLDSKTKLCRLHHYTYSLGSPSERFVTSYEHALITSPSLYSIGNLPWQGRTGLESARNILCPNLRRVYLDVGIDNTQGDEAGGHGHRKVREPVLREVINMEGVGAEPISFRTVRAEALGALSALRVLKLYDCDDGPELPPPSDFPSLETLTYECPEVDTPQTWDALAAFLHRLPRLTTLEISQWNRSMSFTPALNKNLRALHLQTGHARDNPPLRDDHIHHLADLCPNLEKIEIEVPRSRGDAAEVSRYRSLGRLGRLRELNIVLCVSPPNRIHTTADGLSETTFDTVIEPWFDEQDAEYLPKDFAPYRLGHLRDLLSYRAVDEDLARAIFQVISDTRLASVGESPPVLLERLKLSSSEGNRFSGIDINITHGDGSPMNRFLHAVDRQWLLRRDVRDDSREVLHAHEIRMEHSMFLESIFNDSDMKDAEYWFGIWRRVWPVEKEGDWRKNWKSPPLAR